MLETRGWRGVRRWAMRVLMVRVGCGCCGSWVMGVAVVAVDNDHVSENEEEEEEENKPGD